MTLRQEADPPGFSAVGWVSPMPSYGRTNAAGFFSISSA